MTGFFVRPLAAMSAAILGVGLCAAASAPATAAETAAAGGFTVTVDPSHQQQEFEGWGTSLVWMGDKTGGYPDEIRNKLVDMLFGEDGLNLNIARYNIGGGNAPTVKDYLRPGGAVPGFWKAPQAYGPTDKEWWDPDNPAHWNWDADANQRWWIDQIKDKVTTWEAFSNSPPYFQTVSGYVSGGFDANAEQIRADKVDEFAEYLVRVTEHIEDEHGIKFATIDPLNEPNTDYWSTKLGADGQPTGGRQEGAHAGPARQAQVIEALKRRLASAETDAGISAPDETNPSRFVTDFYGWTPAAQAAVQQLNVHTYGTGQRTSARDVAKAEQRPLWMSEVEGSWGKDFTSMNSGLGMAQLIIDDFRELEPTAWVLWQPIEDMKNMVTEGNLQWGSIHVPFDCTATDTLQSCPIKTNTKFDTLRNFTHYIRPGDRMVKVSDKSSLAAVSKDGTAATVVHTNSGATARSVTLDLSKFGTVAGNATVTPVVTSAAGKLVRGAAVAVTGEKATLTVPAQSVTTFLVTGVSGYDKDSRHIQWGHTYRIQGVQSGRSLDATAKIRTNDPAAKDQLWTITKAAGRDRYELLNAGTGQRLAVRGGTVAAEADGASDPAAEWMMSTTGDGTYTLINVGARRLLDVPGGAVTNGTSVSVYTPTSGDNQLWKLLDESVQEIETARPYTVPGVVPTMPETVVAVLHSGERKNLPVTWEMPPAKRFDRAGTVGVNGQATDALGLKIKARAEVTVDTFTATVPTRAKTTVGVAPTLPTTVTGLGTRGGRAELPVTWNAAPAGAFAAVGVVTLTGTARVVDGTTLPATVRVKVTSASDTNVATGNGVTLAATFTENGYSVNGLRNGNKSDKAWSNWKPSARNATDTITINLPEAKNVGRVVTHFYRDGGGGIAQSLRVGVPAAGGGCTSTGAEVPVGTGSPLDVSAPLAVGPVTAVCVVLTAVPSGYLTLAEIELIVESPKAPSDASLLGIQVDGVAIEGFNPATTTYQVAVAQPTKAVVTATATDPYSEVVATKDGQVWTVTSTSEDGSVSTTYRVELTAK